MTGETVAVWCDGDPGNEEAFRRVDVAADRLAADWADPTRDTPCPSCAASSAETQVYASENAELRVALTQAERERDEARRLYAAATGETGRRVLDAIVQGIADETERTAGDDRAALEQRVRTLEVELDAAYRSASAENTRAEQLRERAEEAEAERDVLLAEVDRLTGQLARDAAPVQDPAKTAHDFREGDVVRHRSEGDGWTVLRIFPDGYLSLERGTRNYLADGDLCTLTHRRRFIKGERCPVVREGQHRGLRPLTYTVGRKINDDGPRFDLYWHDGEHKPYTALAAQMLRDVLASDWTAPEPVPVEPEATPVQPASEAPAPGEAVTRETLRVGDVVRFRGGEAFRVTVIDAERFEARSPDDQRTANVPWSHAHDFRRIVRAETGTPNAAKATPRVWQPGECPPVAVGQVRRRAFDTVKITALRPHGLDVVEFRPFGTMERFRVDPAAAALLPLAEPWTEPEANAPTAPMRDCATVVTPQ